jgi:two-component system response regulator HydG
VAIVCSILVIDNEPMTRRVIERSIYLVRHDAIVHQAGSVYEALQVLQQTNVTAIVTDYHLPDGTGLQVISTSMVQDPNRPVLGLSGDPSIGTVMLAGGARWFLAKPVSLPDLLASLKPLC